MGTQLKTKPSLWLGGLLLTLLTGVVGADDDFDHERAWHLQRTGEILPLEEILRRAQQQREGRVLEVELEEHHGQVVYEVELVNALGEVWELRFDAKSGKLLKEEAED